MDQAGLIVTLTAPPIHACPYPSTQVFNVWLIMIKLIKIALYVTVEFWRSVWWDVRQEIQWRNWIWGRPRRLGELFTLLSPPEPCHAKTRKSISWYDTYFLEFNSAAFLDYIFWKLEHLSFGMKVMPLGRWQFYHGEWLSSIQFSSQLLYG